MMELIEKIDRERYSDPDAFDFLVGVDLDTIVLAYEMHPSEMNDSEYCFLFWFKDEEADAIANVQISANIARLRTEDPRGWTTTVDTMGTGLTFIRTWL